MYQIDYVNKPCSGSYLEDTLTEWYIRKNYELVQLIEYPTKWMLVLKYRNSTER